MSWNATQDCLNSDHKRWSQITKPWDLDVIQKRLLKLSECQRANAYRSGMKSMQFVICFNLLYNLSWICWSGWFRSTGKDSCFLPDTGVASLPFPLSSRLSHGSQAYDLWSCLSHSIWGDRSTLGLADHKACTHIKTCITQKETHT